MLPEWSTKAKRAVAFFFRSWNDIDVYVEDTSLSTIQIYNEILVRLSNDKFRVERVFPLGGKRNVIESCENHDSSTGRPSLYVIDGDLNLLCEDSNPTGLKRLYIHERYCIENFLIDENSSIETLYEENGTLSRDDIKNLIKFDNYRDDIECFLELFIIFGAMRKFFPGIKNVSLGLKSFITGGKTPVIDTNEINNYIGKMHNDMCKAYGNDIVLSEELKLHQKALSNNAVLTFVSGKDFLLPALLHRLRLSTKVQSTNNSLKIRIAKSCNIEPLNNFKTALHECSQLI